ncbi:MAG: hypothetical protein LV481_06035 [Methylacidiphilales bacterium]|nr:hypothetical protein [Candidatus Methylacidiphilales bacterium]
MSTWGADESAGFARSANTPIVAVISQTVAVRQKIISSKLLMWSARSPDRQTPILGVKQLDTKKLHRKTGAGRGPSPMKKPHPFKFVLIRHSFLFENVSFHEPFNESNGVVNRKDRSQWKTGIERSNF